MGLAGGIAPQRAVAGVTRPRRTTKWVGAGTGSTGIAAAIAAAVAAEGAPIDGDILQTDDGLFEHVVLDGDRGTHQVPAEFGIVDRADVSGFSGINPVGTVSGWTHGGESGSPTYEVESGRLKMVAPTGSDSAALRWSVSSISGVQYLRIVDLEASGGTQSVVITLATAESNRYLLMRNQSGVWEIRTSGGAWTGMGQSTASAATLDLKYNPATQSVLYRWGSSGEWTAVTGYTVSYALSFRLRVDLTYIGTATTCYIGSLITGPVAT